ncbi:uncharacterized protein B0H18DRAFT_513438 [Fomitopsis serialis]|uniref:uncharacterized protein n=1 Tax=Fomitopsis serialis TaxID=139415 RepID=UPI00200816FF|nr:uncharacterized protein B0H18DRAFT_513438 [Neoantrodia serialis]KAH9922492.1 hypothetical protein B0H18DRAFT_513438 [Neoantrodia serialis]
MPRRSKASAVRVPPPHFPPSDYDSTRTACCTAEDVEMADKVTPHKGPPQGEATDGASKRQNSERNAKRWKAEIFGRIVEPTPEIETFLEEFVPSDDSHLDCLDTEFMAEVPAVEGKELTMYGPLVEGLTSLVRNFPEEKRPVFSNHAHKTMRFPFAMCDDEEHSTMPDVTATIPGLPCIPPVDRWRNVVLVFEAKATATQDPMVRYTEHHEKTLVQLAMSARNIMLAQGRLFAFVVGIYGHEARIFRFDRAGAISSPLFNYVTEPQHLHNFLWRFLNPVEEDCLVVGDDPTSTLGTHEDRQLVQDLTAAHDPEYEYTQENRKAVRRFVVHHGENDKTEYLAYKLISVNPRLFSRATKGQSIGEFWTAGLKSLAPSPEHQTDHHHSDKMVD